MQTRQLGQSDLHISPLGFGTWASGGGNWEYGWGAQDDRDSIAAIAAAVDTGINWVDTAAAYGLGHAETVVGRALRELPAELRPYVFTKESQEPESGAHACVLPVGNQRPAPAVENGLFLVPKVIE